MPRGAKSGENRFKKIQNDRISYRSQRLISVVVPVLKTISVNTKVQSINKFCQLAADIYNEGIPLNEKPIHHRTLKQTSYYWKIIGPIYFGYFESNQKLENFKTDAVLKISTNQFTDISNELEIIRRENKALKLALQNNDNVQVSNHDSRKDDLISENDKLCKLIFHLLARFNFIEVSVDKCIIRDLSNDLEPEDGMLPKDIVLPYINWLRKNSKILGYNNE